MNYHMISIFFIFAVVHNFLSPMKLIKITGFLALCLALFSSCSKDLNINDDWKEIMVVYGLLNPNDSVNYIKITKAFLGPGNALQYAQISDSSNLVAKLKVTLSEYNGTTLVNSFVLDTTMISEKDSGLFYFPDQILYVYRGQLNRAHQYKLSVLDTVTGVEVTSSTYLVNDISIQEPSIFSKANFIPGALSTVKWYSAKYGKRYQLNIHFKYLEISGQDTAHKTVDWLVFSDIKSGTIEGDDNMESSFTGDGFYSAIRAQVPYNASVIRIPDQVQYVFTVGTEELSNYIEVTNPSNTIVQEKPVYTNIENGIGLFTSRTDNTDNNVRLLDLSQRTLDSLKNGSITGDLF